MDEQQYTPGVLKAAEIIVDMIEEAAASGQTGFLVVNNIAGIIDKYTEASRMFELLVHWRISMIEAQLITREVLEKPKK